MSCDVHDPIPIRHDQTEIEVRRAGSAADSSVSASCLYRSQTMAEATTAPRPSPMLKIDLVWFGGEGTKEKEAGGGGNMTEEAKRIIRHCWKGHQNDAKGSCGATFKARCSEHVTVTEYCVLPLGCFRPGIRDVRDLEGEERGGAGDNDQKCSTRQLDAWQQ